MKEDVVEWFCLSVLLLLLSGLVHGVAVRVHEPKGFGKSEKFLRLELEAR